MNTLNENKMTAPVETVKDTVYEKYERYQKISDVMIDQLKMYEIRYDEWEKLLAYIRANIWKRMLYS